MMLFFGIAAFGAAHRYLPGLDAEPWGPLLSLFVLLPVCIYSAWLAAAPTRAGRRPTSTRPRRLTSGPAARRIPDRLQRTVTVDRSRYVGVCATCLRANPDPHQRLDHQAGWRACSGLPQRQRMAAGSLNL